MKQGTFLPARSPVGVFQDHIVIAASNANLILTLSGTSEVPHAYRRIVHGNHIGHIGPWISHEPAAPGGWSTYFFSSEIGAFIIHSEN